MTTTASGLAIGVGEIFGGGIAPVAAGYLANRFGVGHTLYAALGALVIGRVVLACLKETAPHRVHRMSRMRVQSDLAEESVGRNL
jgi:fucose permease